MRLDRYQNGAAPPDRPAAPPARRQLRGDRLGHGDRRDRRAASRRPRRARRRVDLLLRRRRSGQPPRRLLQRRAPARPRLALSLQRAGPGEDRRGLGRHPLYGSHTRGEFEHAEVAVFVGKNPWMSQGFPRARIVLQEIAKDPERSMIVIDPVLTDTAKLADFHLRVRPGTDAWCLAAMVAVLVQEDLADHDVPRRAHERLRCRARRVRGHRRRAPCGELRRRRGADPRRGAADRRRPRRLGLRGPRCAAGAEQHAVLLRQPDAVAADRQLRQPGRHAPAHVVREPLPRSRGCAARRSRASGSWPASCPAT